MSFDLTNLKDRSTFCFRESSWYAMHELALEYGWIPVGTQVRDPENFDDPWDGDYFSNSGQIVTDEDTINLADALTAALQDIPPERTAPELIIRTGMKVTEQWKNDWVVLHANPSSFNSTPIPLNALVLTLEEYEHSNQTPDVLFVDDGQDWDPSPIDYFSGEKVLFLKNFIAFCRKGSFEIY